MVVVIRFSIDRRCEHIKTLQLRKPKPLPTCTDDKGAPTQWHLDQQQWDQLLAHSAQEALEAVDGTKHLNEEVWQHAKQLSIESDARERSIQYAQWSIACEKAALLVNGNDTQKHDALTGERASKGRGTLPKLELKSIATKSGNLAIEHSIWSLPSNLASAGNDLYSSLWAAVEGCLNATASAIRLDQEKGGSDQRQRCIRIYGPLFFYLRHDA